MAYITSRKHPVARTAAAHPLSRAATATLVALALPAAAQTPSPNAPRALPEVRVESTSEGDYKADKSSSPKFTQPLVDTPQTVTVIKKELLQQQGAVTLSDALRNTPGVTFLMGENGNTATGDTVFMRGFDTQGSIFVDGIRDLGTVSRDIFNIEQVEVVKGPAGADIGRGSPTGYINLSSKVPTAENFSAGTLGFGSGNMKRATADLNRSLSDDGSRAFRLNLMKQDSRQVGRDVVENNAYGIAPSMAFGLNTPTRTYLSLLHVKQDNIPDGGIPAIGLPGYYQSLLGSIGGNAPAVDRNNFYGSRNDFNDVEANMLTARVEHDIAPGLTLRNISRIGRTQQQYNLTGVVGLTVPNPADPATWQVARSRQGKDQVNTILTNQTNVTAEFATGAVSHSLSAGVEFIREKQSNVGLGLPAGVAQANASLYRPNVNDAFAPIVRNGGFTEGETTTAALYAFDTLKLSPQWLLNGGLRLERYKTEYFSTPTTAVGGANTALDASDTLVTGKLGLVYKPAPNGSVYVAYATSQKPPGSDNFTLNAPPTGTATTSNINNPNLDPQKATTVELGTKWDVLDNRLALTAAVFRTENKNDLADRDPATGVVTQYGEKRVQGLELGAVGQITPAWQLSAGVASLSTRVTRGANATQNGAAINWSPKLTFTAWSTYKLPMGVTLGGGVRYVDTQARQVNNAPTAATNLPTVPSAVVFDALLAYEVTKNVSLQLNLYNLADKFYVSSVNNGGNRFTLGTPRSALLTANVRF